MTYTVSSGALNSTPTNQAVVLAIVFVRSDDQAVLVAAVVAWLLVSPGGRALKYPEISKHVHI